MSSENIFRIIDPLKAHPLKLSPSNQEKLLALALTQYFEEEIEPDKQFWGLDNRLFNGDSFFHWLFSPKKKFVAQYPKGKAPRWGKEASIPSSAMVISREFFRSPLVRAEMGRMDVFYIFQYKLAKQKFGFPNWQKP